MLLPHSAAAQEFASEQSPDYYPPALTGMRGDHPGLKRRIKCVTAARPICPPSRITTKPLTYKPVWKSWTDFAHWSHWPSEPDLAGGYWSRVRHGAQRIAECQIAELSETIYSHNDF